MPASILMTEVTFYLSNKSGDGVRQALAWRIADKAQKQGRLVYIHCRDPGDHHDVLINLTDQVPDFASRFQRVAEMISGAENERQAGRERFRFYRERGFPVTTHELG
jgi:DNA polymerase-3 subunit chi